MSVIQMSPVLCRSRPRVTRLPTRTPPNRHQATATASPRFRQLVVTATRRTGAERAVPQEHAQALDSANPRGRNSCRPYRTRPARSGGPAATSGCAFDSSSRSRSSTFTSAMCCMRRDGILSQAAQDEPFEILRHTWRSSLGGVGSRCTTAPSVSVTESPENARRPVTIS